MQCLHKLQEKETYVKRLRYILNKTPKLVMRTVATNPFFRVRKSVNNIWHGPSEASTCIKSICNEIKAEMVARKGLRGQ